METLTLLVLWGFFAIDKSYSASFNHVAMLTHHLNCRSNLHLPRINKLKEKQNYLSSVHSTIFQPSFISGAFQSTLMGRYLADPMTFKLNFKLDAENHCSSILQSFRECLHSFH